LKNKKGLILFSFYDFINRQKLHSKGKKELVLRVTYNIFKELSWSDKHIKGYNNHCNIG
jgi:hypothetical protein